MAKYNREMIGSPKSQGKDEEIAYTYTVPAAWGAPGVTTFKAYDITDNAYTDVTATVLIGAGSVLGQVITLPLLKLLTAGHVYRIEPLFSASGNKCEPFLIVHAEN